MWLPLARLIFFCALGPSHDFATWSRPCNDFIPVVVWVLIYLVYILSARIFPNPHQFRRGVLFQPFWGKTAESKALILWAVCPPNGLRFALERVISVMPTFSLLLQKLSQYKITCFAPPKWIIRGTIVNMTKYCWVKISKYIGVCVYRRSYLIWSPEIVLGPGIGGAFGMSETIGNKTINNITEKNENSGRDDGWYDIRCKRTTHRIVRNSKSHRSLWFCWFFIPLGLQSRFGDKRLKFCVICLQSATAVLEGSRKIWFSVRGPNSHPRLSQAWQQSLY